MLEEIVLPSKYKRPPERLAKNNREKLRRDMFEKNYCSLFTIDVHIENIINDKFIDVFSQKIIASFFH